MTQNKPFHRRYLILVLSILFFGIIISLIANITLRSSAVHDANAASDSLVTSHDNSIDQSTSVPSITPSPYVPASEPELINVPEEPVADRVIIQFSPASSEAERAAYIESLGGAVADEIEALDTVVVTVPEEVASKPLPVSPVVAGSEPDHYVAALDSSPNDPRYPEQWALPAIGAPDAWQLLPVGASSVTVAVIDSGICADHPDLDGRIDEGWDFLESDANPQDDFGHGCSVAGVIAANANDGIGIAGIAPTAQIMPLRVLDASGIGSYSNVAAAIVYAADNNAQIINLSLGGPYPSSTLENAITYAVAKDVTIVAAAGNSGIEGALYPAAYPGVIAVGSVDPNLQHSSFSNYGPQVTVWAPGRDILSTARDGSYRLVSGTSFAAPHVAGAAAVEMGRGRSLSLTGSLLSLGEQPREPTPTMEPTDEPVHNPIQSTTNQAHLANPAAVYCVDLGYEYKVVESETGEQGYCLFPDGSQCEQWTFLSGKCGVKYSFCAKKGYETETRSDGNNPFSPEYAVCVTARGESVGSVTDLSDLAAKSGEEVLPEAGPGLNYTPASTAADDTISSEALPTSFDWRNFDGQNWMTSVKNQAACGSCWAFAAVGSLEAQYNINRSNANLDLDLAEEYLVSTCSYAGNCGGGWSDSALMYIRDSGIPDETCMPYTASNSVCSTRCGDWSSRLTFANSVTSFIPTQDSLKQSVVNHGPTVAYLLADGTFDDGIYRCDYDRPDGYYGINHAVVITGYDDAGGYWIVKNSWGSTWNSNGYFNVGYDECNIDSSFATYAVPTVPVPPDPEPPAAPSNLIGVTASKSRIELLWSDNSSNETSFRIEKSPDGINSWSEHVTTEANVTSSYDVGLQCNTHYYYRARAQNSTGNSEYSAVADALTGPCPVPPPNDDLADALTISDNPFMDDLDITAATTEPGDPVTSCGNEQHSNSVWYKYTSAKGSLHVDTWGSDYDTVIAIWKGLPGDFVEVACNDNDDYMASWYHGNCGWQMFRPPICEIKSASPIQRRGRDPSREIGGAQNNYPAPVWPVGTSTDEGERFP